MARRRERRVEPSQDRRKERVRTEDREEKLSDSDASDRKLISIFVVFFIVIPAVSVLVYSTKNGSGTKHLEPVATERGLIKTNISYQEILSENSKTAENVSQGHYDYPVLAYITPWNSRGYEMAKRFNSKFTHLSPVCKGSSLILEGRHIADKGWMSELRMSGDALALKFIKQLGHALHSGRSTRNLEKQLQLVYIIGPPHSEKLQQHDFGPEDLQSLSDAVDGFSLMTYDFSGLNSPGPNAPLKWIHFILQLLLG